MKTRIRFESGSLLAAGSPRSALLLDESKTDRSVIVPLLETIQRDSIEMWSALSWLEKENRPACFGAVLCLEDAMCRVVTASGVTAVVEYPTGTIKIESFTGSVQSVVLPIPDVVYLQQIESDPLLAGGVSLVGGSAQASRLALELRERTQLSVPAATLGDQSESAEVAEDETIRDPRPAPPPPPSAPASKQPPPPPATPASQQPPPPPAPPASQQLPPPPAAAGSNAAPPVEPLVRAPAQHTPVEVQHAQPSPVEVEEEEPKEDPTQIPCSNEPIARLVTDDGLAHDLCCDVIIGREPIAHPNVEQKTAVAWRLPDHSLELSRAHLGIFIENGQIMARDLGSSNGSILVSKATNTPTPIYSSTATPVEIGDVILLGKRSVEIELL